MNTGYKSVKSGIKQEVAVLMGNELFDLRAYIPLSLKIYS